MFLLYPGSDSQWSESAALSNPKMCSAGSTMTTRLNEEEVYEEIMDCEEEVDPRVKQELEILNQAGGDVNRLEKEIDEARAKYQTTFSECSQALEALKKKDGASIKRARPYFELKEAARQAQSEAVRSARKFQSANSVYLAAKETISLAELRLLDDKTVSLSKAWQEMLNHAVIRVMEAEAEKSLSEKDHCKKAAVFSEMEQKLSALEKKNKRSISKAWAYFDVKKELEVKLLQLKQTVEDLQQALKSAKQKYAGALKRLEQISDSIHERRKLKYILMYPREPGVGAEESNAITEHQFPSLYTPLDADGQEYYYNYDDDVFKNDECVEDDVNDMENEKLFREMILTISLDDDDTSFMKQTKSGRMLISRQRSRSLPTLTDNCLRPGEKPCLNRSFNLEFSNTNFESPLWDREDSLPPDGNSMSSDKNDITDNCNATVDTNNVPLDEDKCFTASKNDCSENVQHLENDIKSSISNYNHNKSFEDDFEGDTSKNMNDAQSSLAPVNNPVSKASNHQLPEIDCVTSDHLPSNSVISDIERDESDAKITTTHSIDKKKSDIQSDAIYCVQDYETDDKVIFV
ncbi:SH3 domain-binding protein 5-like isoform X1 [Biomphalaria pfeifferi]|uniref:SH3 domain-binding protein 5-like isoform X1 n=1 Tax=Biomphalaria pfeifferi TaxID=112525 RepID=A0AAD8F3C4_BIOPF|nr:SH3 domain-binding protein 5-like isoform X1 [Biomphalaria pfeifferi]